MSSKTLLGTILTLITGIIPNIISDFISESENFWFKIITIAVLMVVLLFLSLHWNSPQNNNVNLRNKVINKKPISKVDPNWVTRPIVWPKKKNTILKNLRSFGLGVAIWLIIIRFLHGNPFSNKQFMDTNYPNLTDEIISSKEDTRLQNIRADSNISLWPVEVVEKWFYYLNNGEDKKACSLESLRKCDSNNQTDVLAKGREKNNLVNGYENIEVKSSGIWSNSKEVVCARYSYLLQKNSSWRLWYLEQFHIEKKYWRWELVSRVLEKKFQEWRWPIPVQEPTEYICYGSVFTD